jgi:hypothetical protein
MDSRFFFGYPDYSRGIIRRFHLLGDLSQRLRFTGLGRWLPEQAVEGAAWDQHAATDTQYGDFPTLDGKIGGGAANP